MGSCANGGGYYPALCRRAADRIVPMTIRSVVHRRPKPCCMGSSSFSARLIGTAALRRARQRTGADLRAVWPERLVLHMPATGSGCGSGECRPAGWLLLRDAPQLQFVMLIDVAGVDYLDTAAAGGRPSRQPSGFSRVNCAAAHAAGSALRGRLSTAFTCAQSPPAAARGARVKKTRRWIP